MSIEAIVTGMMTQVRKEKGESIRLDERLFAAAFAASLPKRADKPAAIREASTELRRISLSNMLPSIEQASLILGTPSEITEHAKALYRFRSSDLSHPGRGDSDSMDKWLRMGPTVEKHCLADAVARHFLTGYCANVHGQSDEPT